MPPKKRTLSPNDRDNPSKKKKEQNVGNTSMTASNDHNTIDIGQPSTSQTVFEIMHALAPIPPVKIFQTGRDSGLISQMNLQVAFGLDTKILNRIESFIVGPSYENLVNIATCDYTHFHTTGKYRSVILHESKGGAPCLFYTVGVVSHSDLVTGNNSHQICIVPTDLSWNRIAAVMGKFFKQKRLALSAFKNGVSFSTLKRKDSSANQPMNSLGISTPSFSKAPMARSRNVPLPYNCDVPTFDGRTPFRLPEYKNLPKIHTEINPGSAVIVMFSLGAYDLSDGAAMSYGVTDGVSLNIQSVVLLAEALKADAPITSKISNATLHLGVLSETESSDSEDQTEGTDNEPESQLM